ncbi:Aldo/keto reductase [Suhomyces tanzawaensis NRRL Y-17324]|uniref:Aldo/keto reductase n=1 Tax=Suhomyces tanzawaensis NRRL Y-17324 TaxID=984487 RepID=A0A1E4SB20_9ASCO|nr:Aldo/keto reductase [Suhomyces tanzawaensis NRRL Y-17324]ODV76720.1 Aldo/keto reductase [Suhomyces tanzawaensis NRRL Y-17324]
MHWPIALNPENKSHPFIPLLPSGKRDILLDWDFVEGYEELQKIHALGKAKSIGVSNFSVTNLKKLLADPRTKIRPVVNQVELHPYLPQHKLLAYAKQEDILLQAYSPLGSTDLPLLTDEVILELGKKYEVAPATILISWAVWRGTVVLPKSVTSSRIESNFNIVTLSDEDGKKIDNIHVNKGIQRLIMPEWSPVVVFDSNE